MKEQLTKLIAQLNKENEALKKELEPKTLSKYHTLVKQLKHNNNADMVIRLLEIVAKQNIIDKF